MKRFKPIIVLMIVAAALLVVTCGKDQPTNIRPGGDAEVIVSFLPSSLAQQIELVILRVVSGDVTVHTDTTTIVDGTFSFPPVEVPVGPATFYLSGIDANGATIYAGETTVTIAAGEASEENTVDVQLVPAVPMVKLSPYHSEVELCQEYNSTLELFNIDKFFSGTFKILYDHELLSFTGSISQADAAWGDLEISTVFREDTLVVFVGRAPGSSDAVPPDVYSLADLTFQTQAGGDVGLTILTETLIDLQGQISEWDLLHNDGQTAAITGEPDLGSITGTVRDARTLAPIAEAVVHLGESVIYEVLTGPDGTYSFDNVPLGTWPIIVSKANYITSQQSAIVTCASLVHQVDFQLVPEPGAVVIAVRDENDQFTEGVSVIRLDQSNAMIDTQTTDADGEAAWAALPGGESYRFEAIAPGHDVPEGELWGATPIIQIPPAGAVNETITRHLPLALAVIIRDREGNMASEFYPLDTVRATIRLDNRDVEAYALRVHSEASRDPGVSVDLQHVHELSIGELSTDSVIFEMVPTADGAYFVRPWKTAALIGGGFRTTDSWAWPTGIDFTVLPARPDLVPQQVAFEDQLVAPGDPLAVNVTVANDGLGVSGTFYVMAYLSETPNVSPTSPNSLGRCLFSSLGPAQSELCLISGAVPTDITPGSYYVCVYVDYLDENDEPDETNNSLCATQMIEVSLLPQLDVDSTRLEFAAVQLGDLPPAKQFTIANAGGGTLSWGLTYAASWLNVAPISNVANSSTVTVDITDISLPADTYYDTLRIGNTTVTGDSAFVEVIYTLAPAPTGDIIITVFDLDSVPAGNAYVRRYGTAWDELDMRTVSPNGTATWVALPADSIYHFRALHQSEVVAGTELWGQATDVAVAGGLTTEVSIYRNFPFAAGLVIRDVEGVEISEAVMGESVVLSFSVENRHPVSWPVSVYVEAARETLVTPDFFDQSPVKQITGGTTDTVNFLFDPPIAGDYYIRPQQVITTVADVNWLTDSDPWPAATALTVTPPPQLEVTPSNLFFAALAYEDLPPSQNFNIINAGGGVLNWSAATSSGWMHLSQTSGTGDATVAVSINNTYFNPQTLLGKVIVTNTSDGDTDTVDIRYDVNLPGWTFGGVGHQEGWGIDTASGGNGYIIAGSTNPTLGERDVYLSEISPVGDSLWASSYDYKGHGGNDHAYSVIATSDGGYAVAGYTGTGAGGAQWPAFSVPYLLKVGAVGDWQWDFIVGCGECTNLWEGAIGITELLDGFALVGFRDSCTGYDPQTGFQSCWRADGLLVRVWNIEGVGGWSRSYPIGDWDELFDLFVGPDNGLVCVGQSKPPDDPDWAQVWVVALDGQTGDVWGMDYIGEPGTHDAGRAVIDLGGGNMVIAGYTASHGAGGRDFYLLQTDGTNVPFYGWFGGTGFEVAYGLAPMNNGYVVVGFTNSVELSVGGYDVYVVQFNQYCQPLWSRTYGGLGDDVAHGVVGTPDGGCIIVGTTESFGVDGKEIWILRLNSDGSVWQP